MASLPRGYIWIDQYGFNAFFAKGFHSLRTGVIKLASLANGEATAAYNDHLFNLWTVELRKDFGR